MRKAVVYLAALMVLGAASLAKQKPKLPDLLTKARYVLVTTMQGDTPDQRMFPEDRQAMVDVQSAVQDWGQYKLAHKPEDADLIFVVRKGRSLGAKSGIQIRAGSDWPKPSVNPNNQSDTGDPLDTLLVYDARQGVDSPPLWRGRLRDGLNSPDVRLVQELRTEVERSLKKP